MTLIDSHVVLDLVKDDSDWADWSLAQLDRAAVEGPLLINDVIYAEISVGYDKIEDLDRAIAIAGLSMAAIPRAALFLAGKAYRATPLVGWHTHGRIDRFFHRRACFSHRPAAIDSRHRPLPNVFSRHYVDLARRVTQAGYNELRQRQRRRNCAGNLRRHRPRQQGLRSRLRQ